MPATKPSDVCDLAADLITPKFAWRKGDWESVKNGQTCYCLEGALNVASGMSARVQPYHGPGVTAYDAVRDELRKMGSVNRNLFWWNDNQKDKRKVIRLLRRVARKLRAQGQ